MMKAKKKSVKKHQIVIKGRQRKEEEGKGRRKSDEN